MESGPRFRGGGEKGAGREPAQSFDRPKMSGWRGRWLEGGDDFDFVGEELGFGALAEDEVYDSLEGLIGVGGAVADAGNTKGESLPQVVVVDLSNGHVELV